MGAGRRKKLSGHLWGQPQDANVKGSSQSTAHLPTSLTIGTAERDLGMCSGKTGAQTAAKSGQMETVEPQSYFSSHTPSPAPLTHKSLVDKVFCKVDQHQRDDVPQETLEESGDVSERQEAEDPHRAPPQPPSRP